MRLRDCRGKQGRMKTSFTVFSKKNTPPLSVAILRNKCRTDKKKRKSQACTIPKSPSLKVLGMPHQFNTETFSAANLFFSNIFFHYFIKA